MDDLDEWLNWQDQIIANPPPAPAGFVLIECGATPRHWPTYTITDDYGYPAGCLYCAHQQVFDAHAGCRHSHHRVWRRWRVTHWIAGQLYVTGITSNGGCVSWGDGCNACQTMPTWGRGRRGYALWVPLDTWRCLLRMRHWPGDPIGFGMCSKCLPCPDCGSRTAGHLPGCGGSS